MRVWPLCLLAATLAAEDSGTVLASLPGEAPGAGGVAVTIGWHGPDRLHVRLAPVTADEPMRLYDTALPKTGLQGVGRPTLVEIAPGQPIAATGPATAAQELGPAIAGLRSYPAGPVDLVVPVERVGPPTDAPVRVELLLTYMACGETFCREPVTDRRVSVELPPDRRVDHRASGEDR